MNKKLETFLKSLITILGWILGTIGYLLSYRLSSNSITIGIFIICILLGSLALISILADSLKWRILLALTPTLGAIVSSCFMLLIVGNIFNKVLF